jgi:hypothetical protein
MGKIICKTNENIFQMRFVMPGQNYRSNSRFVFGNDSTLIDMSWLNVDYYPGYSLNEHHITTDSYYGVVLPFISLYIKDFAFKRSDFRLETNVIRENGKIEDISYLVPLDDSLRFTMSKDGNDLFLSETFESLHFLKTDWCDESTGADSEYHKLFRGSHSCCRVVNESLPDGKSIIITGDSMVIPWMPILCCYFREVVLLDNRDGKSHTEYYEGKEFDYVVVQFWEGRDAKKPLSENLI